MRPGVEERPAAAAGAPRRPGPLAATIAGSLPKPAWLADPEVLWPAWRLPAETLAEGQRDAVRLALLAQERAGIDVVTDGEQTRQHFVHGFTERLAGVDAARRVTIGIRGDRYRASVPRVVGPVRRERAVHADEVRWARAQTDRWLKFTLPGPMTIADTVADEHYRDRGRLAMDLADAIRAEAAELAALGVDVIQLDEPAFNVDPYFPEVREWGIAALDRAVEGLPCLTAVHVCYGYGIKANVEWKQGLGAEWRQYERTFPLLAASRIGQVSLEYAGSRVPLGLLRLLGDKSVLAGVIDVATDRVETPDEVAATIRQVLAAVPPERCSPGTNCGMAPLARGVADAKLAALGRGAALVRAELAGAAPA
jgi:5-methyltetrahydropteroyltriglutamate--homocysteine methyltransferase